MLTMNIDNHFDLTSFDQGDDRKEREDSNIDTPLDTVEKGDRNSFRECP